MSKKQAHVAAYKKENVAKLCKKLKEAKIIGIIDMQNLPAAQLLGLKKALKGKIELFMTKQRLMKVAIESVKKDIPGLEDLFAKRRGMPALLFTHENPFLIYKTIKKSKSPAPAKAGQKAPRDLSVQAGPTPFAPGPVMSELGQLGIKAGVENGKVAIKADAVVCKEGKEISAPLASMLLRLGIQPMEIGLTVIAMLEKGVVYENKVLDIDDKLFEQQLNTAIQEAINLSVETAYLTHDTREMLIAKAAMQARALSIETGFITKETVGEIFAKAEAQAEALKTEAKL